MEVALKNEGQGEKIVNSCKPEGGTGRGVPWEEAAGVSLNQVGELHKREIGNVDGGRETAVRRRKEVDLLGR